MVFHILLYPILYFHNKFWDNYHKGPACLQLEIKTGPSSLVCGSIFGSIFDNLNRSMCKTCRILYSCKKSHWSDIDCYLIGSDFCQPLIFLQFICFYTKLIWSNNYQYSINVIFYKNIVLDKFYILTVHIIETGPKKWASGSWLDGSCFDLNLRQAGPLSKRGV